MTEEFLKKYFDRAVSADALSSNLIDTISGEPNNFHYNIFRFKSDKQFVVTSEDLIKLCKDIIDNKIKLPDLKAIAFCLESSDYFTYDSETKEGQKVSSAICNWYSPNINTPTTIDYIKYCAYYLETGEHR